MILTKLKLFFTPARIYLAVGIVALVIILVTAIRSCSDKEPVRPITPPKKPAKRISVPTKRETDAEAAGRELDSIYPIKRHD